MKCTRAYKTFAHFLRDTLLRNSQYSSRFRFSSLSISLKVSGFVNSKENLSLSYAFMLYAFGRNKRVHYRGLICSMNFYGDLSQLDRYINQVNQMASECLLFNDLDSRSHSRP